MMTRKDYVSTANILANIRESVVSLGIEGENVFDNLINDFAKMFLEDNDRFDFDRFEMACFDEVN